MCREPSWEGGRSVWFRVRVASQAPPFFFYHAGSKIKLSPCIHPTSHHSGSTASMTNIPILQQRTLRHKEGKKLTQDYTTDNQMYPSPDPRPSGYNCMSFSHRKERTCSEGPSLTPPFLPCTLPVTKFLIYYFQLYIVVCGGMWVHTRERRCPQRPGH